MKMIPFIAMLRDKLSLCEQCIRTYGAEKKALPPGMIQLTKLLTYKFCMVYFRNYVMYFLSE